MDQAKKAKNPDGDSDSEGRKDPKGKKLLKKADKKAEKKSEKKVDEASSSQPKGKKPKFQQTIPCEIPGCTKMFGRTHDRKRHMSNVHRDPTAKKDPSEKCPHCYTHVAHAGNLKRHISSCKYRVKETQRMMTPPAEESQKAKTDRLTQNLKDAEKDTISKKLIVKQAEKYEEERRQELDSYLQASTSQARSSSSRSSRSPRSPRSSKSSRSSSSSSSSSNEETGKVTSSSSGDTPESGTTIIYGQQ
jgi:hypothetical protein